MPLIDSLRRELRDPGAASFQLLGEDLALIGTEDLRAAISEYDAAVARIGAAQREFLVDAHHAFRREAHSWLRQYNQNVHRRVAGYLALARRCRFRYPWPVVAVLGICQVLEGMKKNRGWGFAGEVMSRVGIGDLANLADNTEDVLRRTNRAIFADSVPTVLYALRALDHATRGEHELVHLLVEGPLPLLFDEANRRVVRELVAAMQLDDAEVRFARLAKLTLEHFDREQSIFSYQLGGARKKTAERRMASRLFRMRTVEAPHIVRDRKGRGSLAFTEYELPEDFDIRDHEARVREFGRAFVSSVTATVDDYRIAAEHAVRRFEGRRATVPAL